MYQLFICLLSVVLLVVGTANAQYRSASTIPVHNVEFKGIRAMEVLKAVAQKYRVVIGVYGIRPGADWQGIDIVASSATLADILDAVIQQDANYEWYQNGNGAIHVRVKKSPLTLLDLPIQSFDIADVSRSELPNLISRTPKVKDWLRQHNCSILELASIVGRPSRRDPKLTVSIRDESLSSVLDAAAVQSDSYFWSMIQYSNQPCEINIQMVPRRPE